MKKFLFLFAFLVSIFAFAQKPIFVSAKVKAATVYFNLPEISQTTSAVLFWRQLLITLHKIC